MARRRILVVDDEEANRVVFGQLLRMEGYDVATADGGREALRRLQQEEFDLVLTDMLMPDLDGVELMIAVRKMAKRPAVIPMSGGGELVSAAQMLSIAVKMGARAPLVKPFTRDELVASVASVLKP